MMDSRQNKVRVIYDRRIFATYHLFVLPRVRLENQGRVVLLDMVVDMGATDIVVDPEVFDGLGIQPSRQIYAVSATSRHRGARGKIERVAVSREPVAENVSVVAMDLPEGLVGEGLLGASFLQRFPFFVDYARGLLEFWT